MNVRYKILVEVKLFHEYYLTEETGKTIFEYSGQPDKSIFLTKAFEMNRPTIANDISFEILPNSKALFANHKLRLVPSYSGFRILVQVDEKVLPDNSVAFVPVVPLLNGMIVGLKRKNTDMDVFTNARVSTPMSSIFYFSNSGAAGSNSFPALSARVPSYSVLTSYEQGELSLSTSGTLQSYFLGDNGSEQWLAVTGEGFVNEDDRILVTPRFRYTFPAGVSITEAQLKVRDSRGAEIHSISVNHGEVIRKVEINLDARAIFQGSSGDISERFTLEVVGNNFQQEHVLMFINADVTLRDYWGIVHLVPRVDDDRFNLIAEDGYLRTRKNPDGSTSVPEYFEIRIKSRPTFWRYANQQGKKIKVNPMLDDFLKYDAVKGMMTSLAMRSASRTPTDFVGNGNTKFLPHPLSFDTITIEEGRMITEIRVPRSDLFDV